MSLKHAYASIVIYPSRPHSSLATTLSSLRHTNTLKLRLLRLAYKPVGSCIGVLAAKYGIPSQMFTVSIGWVLA